MSPNKKLWCWQRMSKKREVELRRVVMRSRRLQAGVRESLDKNLVLLNMAKSVPTGVAEDGTIIDLEAERMLLARERLQLLALDTSIEVSLMRLRASFSYVKSPY